MLLYNQLTLIQTTCKGVSPLEFLLLIEGVDGLTPRIVKSTAFNLLTSGVTGLQVETGLSLLEASEFCLTFFCLGFLGWTLSNVFLRFCDSIFDAKSTFLFSSIDFNIVFEIALDGLVIEGEFSEPSGASNPAVGRLRVRKIIKTYKYL